MNMQSFASAAFLWASAQALLANGGGYFRGGVENTGDVAGFEPKATENIRILDEKLIARLGPKEADVEVRYLMRNITDKKVKVRFGFPVEESSDENLMGAPGEAKLPDGKRLAYCRDYRITCGGKEVKANWQGEVEQDKDARFKRVAGWLISEITFAAAEEKPVKIQFRSAYPLEEWGVSDDESRSAAFFRYRLSTAACWAGTIGSGHIQVEANGIDPADIKVLKPVNRFRKEGEKWVWNFEDLEPTLADDIEIECRPEERVYGHRTLFGYASDTPSHQILEYVERGKRWSMLHSNYQVRASSTLKPDGEITYAAENVRDRWEKIVWSEGAAGPGSGEWLEITPAQPKPLIEILIAPGYQKENLFKANARPKKVNIELNGTHRFDADIPDLEDTVSIPVKGYTKPVRKVRLTFTEVYPGTRFEDLCVTSVRLHALLDKKPNVQPAR